VSIWVAFNVDQLRAAEFVEVMAEVRLIHLRNWAYRWQLQKDPTRPDTCYVEMTVPSRNEHLMQLERMTKLDKDLLEKTWCTRWSSDEESNSSDANIAKRSVYLFLRPLLRQTRFLG